MDVTARTIPTAHRDVVAEKIGSCLVEEGALSREQLQAVLARPTGKSRRPGWKLVDAGAISEDTWAERLARLFNIASAHLDDFSIDEVLIRKVPEDMARRYEILPITNTGAEIYLAVCDPTQLSIFDHVGNLLGAPVQPIIVPPSQLEKALQKHYMAHDISDLEHVQVGALDQLNELELRKLKEGGESERIVELVDRLLVRAIAVGASDIHIEPFADQLVIRFRVDGLLRNGPSYPAAISPWIVSRVKVLARLDIAERYVPQDGRVRLRKAGRDIDLRVSCLPVVHGEKVVIRLLNHDKVLLSLEDLGFDGRLLEALRREVRRPQGMVLVTGPTGSGKSTTLYAALQEVARPEINVITVEDPVEYEIKGLNQVPINTKRGVTFARALRAILRQDPDVVLVGEIRDQETGITAATASMTGHMLLSTLHTNDAVSAVHRLFEMGVPRHLVAPSLSAVMAQRLVRRVCPGCAYSRPAEPGELDAVLPGLDGEEIHIPCAAGCSECEGSGYKGRTLVYELLVVDEEMREVISSGGTTSDIARLARQQGFRDMREVGLEKVFAGHTTIEELLRVIVGG